MATGGSAALLHDLVELRQGAGATTERCESFTTFRRLRAYKRALELTGEHGAAVQMLLYSAAMKLVGSHGHRKIASRDVMLAAYALTPSWTGPLLADRLQALGSARENTAGNTVRGYLPDATPELRSMLSSLKNEELLERPEGPDEHLLGDDEIYELEAQIRWTITGRVPMYHATRKVRARLRPLERFKFPFRYPNDQKSPVEVVPLANCDSPTVEPELSHWLSLYVRVPHTEPNNEVEFSYLIRVKSKEHDQSYLRHYSQHHGKPATVGVLFEPGDAPTHVWVFENATETELPKSGSPDDAIVVPSTNAGPAYVQHTFNQHRGRYFGLVWSWPDSTTPS